MKSARYARSIVQSSLQAAAAPAVVPRVPSRARVALALTLTALLTGTLACASIHPHTVVDLAMSSAYRPPAGPAALPPLTHPASDEAASPRYELLAGDLHCHVQPPDSTAEVSRGVPETVALATRENLDFVVLTPHVWSHFFDDPDLRAAVLEGRSTLRSTLAALPTGKTIFVLGMEYTDHRYGHVAASFADLDAVLAEVPVASAQQHPELFFERFVAHGGLLVINHPLVTPLDSIIPIARADLSWRPFTAPGPFPAEILAVNRLAQAYEVFNLSATDLRDRFLLHDRGVTLDATLGRMDREIALQHRRITPVGGSDSHSHHLRATTFVLAKSRTEEGIREALLAGRTCVRSPEACSLEVRPRGGAWAAVGGAVRGPSLDARAQGEDIAILVDGVKTRAPSSGEVTRIDVDPARCTVIRAQVGEGFSAPIYANCDL